MSSGFASYQLGSICDIAVTFTETYIKVDKNNEDRKWNTDVDMCDSWQGVKAFNNKEFTECAGWTV
jgi:hypothetical protein